MISELSDENQIYYIDMKDFSMLPHKIFEENDPFTNDRGYLGHKSAKMMKKSKVMEQRIEKAIDEKSNLLKNVDRNDSLKIIPIESRKSPLILVNNLQIKYNDKIIFSPVSFEVKNGDRIAIVGKNGIGKSSILKLIIGQEIQPTLGYQF